MQEIAPESGGVSAFASAPAPAPAQPMRESAGIAGSAGSAPASGGGGEASTESEYSMFMKFVADLEHDEEFAAEVKAAEDAHGACALCELVPTVSARVCWRPWTSASFICACGMLSSKWNTGTDQTRLRNLLKFSTPLVLSCWFVMMVGLSGSTTSQQVSRLVGGGGVVLFN